VIGKARFEQDGSSREYAHASRDAVSL
jgi:hypothetical protein